MSVCTVVRERQRPTGHYWESSGAFLPGGGFLESRIFSEELGLPSADQGLYPRVRRAEFPGLPWPDLLKWRPLRYFIL